MLDTDLLAAYNAVRTTPNTKVFCHAPFASMNFAQNGDATVCCYNRKYVLGTYPSATLDDIWHGARAQELRGSMARNELPRGCDICLSQFWSSNFSGLRARSFDHLAEREYGGEVLSSYPKLMEFEISNVCNLECTMCTGEFSSSIRHNREKLPPLKSPYDDAFVRQLEAFIPHLQEARFLGGEPFLVRTYYQIWDMIARLQPQMTVSITTNATILNDRVKGVLEKLRANIIVSIDSVSRDTYERIRVNANYDEVMRNVDYFCAYAKRKGTGLTFAVCPMRQNWSELPAIVEYCNTRRVGVYFNTVVFPGDATFLYMTHGELERIVSELRSTPFFEGADMGRTAIWHRRAKRLQRSNNENFRDLVRQIAGYRDRKAGFVRASRTPLPGQDWDVLNGQGYQATLEHPAGPDGPLRLTLGAQGAPGSRPVRLQSRQMALRTNQRYVLEFRGRAAGGCDVTVGARREDSPSRNLGLYLRFGLTPKWERFEVDFVPDGDEDSGQFMFDVAHGPAEIELADISVRAVPAEETDTPAVAAPLVVATPVTLLRPSRQSA